MSTIPNSANWFSKIKPLMTNRELLIRNQIAQYLNRTTRMIKYNNLPDTIPAKDYSILCQVNGYAIITDVPDNGLYAFYGGLGGTPNPYYLPTVATVANPALNYSKNLKIDEECVVILNDSLYQGLMPILQKYAEMVVDAEITLRYGILNARIPKLITADNDNAYQSATEYFEKLEQGSAYGIITTDAFQQDIVKGLEGIDFDTKNSIKDTIEALQYLKGSCYNELGLKATFNMKREAINEAEASLNDNILYPLIDDMLEQQQIGWDKVNAMYGTNVSVEFDSVWEENRIEDEIYLEQLESDVKATEGEAEAEETEEREEETDETNEAD